MTIIIHEATQENIANVNQVDGSFEVNARLSLSARDGRISYTFLPVEPYTKRYPPDEIDYRAYIASPDKALYFAFCDGALAGQIILRKNWNKLAYVEDIAVDARFRRQGIGRALMSRAVEWAKSQGLPGIMLETQDVNAAACRFYARFGFVPGGFDRLLYTATLPGSAELALYWYLIFSPE